MGVVSPFTYNKLRGRIVEKYGSQNKFADRIGISKQSVSLKMNGKTEFSQNDIDVWANALDIEREQYVEFFFT